MNRRANAYLNVISFTSFILMFLLFVITMRLESIDNMLILKNITSILTLIMALSFIACEMLLFMLLQNRYKGLYIMYLFGTIILTIYLNNIIPYIFTISFVIFKLIVDVSRIIFVNKLYINRRFTTYCRRYGIKIKDWKKTYKKKKPIKKKDVIGVPVPTGTATATTLSTNT
jgi:hypothetical protein